MEQDKSPNLKRRGYHRLKENIFIFCRQSSGSWGEFKAITSDIGGGGLMFETERDISAGEALELEIYQPDDCQENTIVSIPVLAKIAWKKQIEKENFQQGENRYRIGIEFLEIEEGDRKMIAQYVKEKTSE